MKMTPQNLPELRAQLDALNAQKPSPLSTVTDGVRALQRALPARSAGLAMIGELLQTAPRVMPTLLTTTVDVGRLRTFVEGVRVGMEAA